MTEIRKDRLSNSLDKNTTNLDNSNKNRVFWCKIKNIFSSPIKHKNSAPENELEMNYESRKSLHDILSNLVREETVIEKILDKTSQDTKIKLAMSNFNLNEKDENSLVIDRFINATNFIESYLKKYENDVVKYTDPIKEEKPKPEPKKTIFRKKNPNLIDEENKLIHEHLKVINDFKILITTRSSKNKKILRLLNEILNTDI
ncbi:hypothetical protein BpHYR1_019274 [Brachionus plicatilis]|uniref:Uncharacterized protein n=1 Tax=Brachionus plicatilis TaxID=10195 RepID=A0A3M7QR06_BRAPC|nr:hypothetical protein BpHYR1_019274 [Brachionus plicatilis]